MSRVFANTTHILSRISYNTPNTATRDLADLFANGLLRLEGIGKATRYCVNIPGWEQPLRES